MSKHVSWTIIADVPSQKIFIQMLMQNEYFKQYAQLEEYHKINMLSFLNMI